MAHGKSLEMRAIQPKRKFMAVQCTGAGWGRDKSTLINLARLAYFDIQRGATPSAEGEAALMKARELGVM